MEFEIGVLNWAQGSTHHSPVARSVLKRPAGWEVGTNFLAKIVPSPENGKRGAKFENLKVGSPS